MVSIANGNVVFGAACVGVCVEPQTRRQSFLLNKHRGAISCVALHPSGQLVATGELAAPGAGRGPASVFVWDPDSKRVAARLQLEDAAKGVVSLGFSPRGALLAVVSLDPRHTLRVFDWEHGLQVACAPCDVGRVSDLAWVLDGAFSLERGKQIFVDHPTAYPAPDMRGRAAAATKAVHAVVPARLVATNPDGTHVLRVLDRTPIAGEDANEDAAETVWSAAPPEAVVPVPDDWIATVGSRLRFWRRDNLGRNLTCLRPKWTRLFEAFETVDVVSSPNEAAAPPTPSPCPLPPRPSATTPNRSSPAGRIGSPSCASSAPRSP